MSSHPRLTPHAAVIEPYTMPILTQTLPRLSGHPDDAFPITTHCQTPAKQRAEKRRYSAQHAVRRQLSAGAYAHLHPHPAHAAPWYGRSSRSTRRHAGKQHAKPVDRDAPCHGSEVRVNGFGDRLGLRSDGLALLRFAFFWLDEACSSDAAGSTHPTRHCSMLTCLLHQGPL